MSTIELYVVADSEEEIDLSDGANRSPVFTELEDATNAAVYQGSSVYVVTAQVVSIKQF
jgi:hypothetical protein